MIARQVLAWLAVAAMLVPLAVYGWGGMFMRYSGDDYCYGSELAHSGFVQNQVYSYLHPLEYNGNRFSLTLFSNLGDLLGRSSPAIMPALAILFWLVGLFLLIRSLSALIGMKVEAWMIALASGLLVFLGLYQAPMILQALYWRTSMLTYLAPLVSLTWLFALGLMTLRSHRNLIAPTIGLAVLAFLSAGFSETGAVLQTGVLNLALLYLFLSKGQEPEKRRRAVVVGLAMLAASLVAVILLALSPSNASRYGSFPHPNLAGLIYLSLRYGLTFIIESLKGYPLPAAVGLSFFGVIGLNIGLPGAARTWGIPRWLLVAGGYLLATGLLVALSAAPSVLARATYPEPRAWMPGRAVMTAGLAGLGLILGMALQGPLRMREGIRNGLLVVAVLGACVYSLHAIPYIRNIFSPVQAWSQAWDARDRDIRIDITGGKKDLVVPALEMVIPWVAELQSDPENWYNQCAAEWYGVDSITAVEQP